MNKNIVICVECSKQFPTDSIYIDKILKHIYNLDETKINFIFLGGKGNFNDNKIIKNINKYLSYKNINTKIIFCLDTDNITTSPEDIKLNKAIELYCNSKNYKLVWFCRNIEEVIINKIIQKNKKVYEAKKFQNTSTITSELMSRLMHEDINIKKSNFLCVFDKELIRK